MAYRRGLPRTRSRTSDCLGAGHAKEGHRDGEDDGREPEQEAKDDGHKDVDGDPLLLEEDSKWRQEEAADQDEDVHHLRVAQARQSGDAIGKQSLNLGMRESVSSEGRVPLLGTRTESRLTAASRCQGHSTVVGAQPNARRLVRGRFYVVGGSGSVHCRCLTLSWPLPPKKITLRGVIGRSAGRAGRRWNFAAARVRV